MTGRRFARLEERILTLEERLQTLESVKTQKQAAEAQKETSKLLDNAERFTLVILLPYYLPYGVSKALSLFFKKEFGTDGPGQKVLTILAYGLVFHHFRKDFYELGSRTYRRLTTKSVNFFLDKKRKLKTTAGRYVNRKRAIIRTKHKRAKESIKHWRDASREILIHAYFVPSRAIEGIRRLIKTEKPPSSTP